MFHNPKYLTHGVRSTIPEWLVILLWQLIECMEAERDYLQVFRLTAGDGCQRIEHTQEQPPYRRELRIPCPDAVNAKLFVIDDNTHSTMLLAEEY